jgi:hypothetical protein
MCIDMDQDLSAVVPDKGGNEDWSVHEGFRSDAGAGGEYRAELSCD